jgi:nicotinate phosphoribosyltransferase
MLSMLDDDVYKFTMAYAVMRLYPNAIAEYRFHNRGPERFNGNFITALDRKLDNFCDRLTQEEKIWLQSKFPYIDNAFFDWLKSYVYDREELTISLTEDADLDIKIRGPWYRTILWEVKLLAAISEIYFKNVCKTWETFDFADSLMEKSSMIKDLSDAKFNIIDFGTRRRRSAFTHSTVVEHLSKNKYITGTSNMFLAKEFDLKPIGTMAHEWIMGISELESLRYANKYALNKWQEIYNGNLGIALTDTFGTDAFLKDFDLRLAKLYDGVRQDSGDPYYFALKMIEHYQKLGIDPKTKTIVFSDSLTVPEAINIFKYCNGNIKTVLGIGTNLSNDFTDKKALNMVIKLHSINNIPVVKLSDVPGKETGDPKAIEIAKYIYNNRRI